MKKNIVILCLLLLCNATHTWLGGYSPRRKKNPSVPTMVTTWHDNTKKKYTLSDSHLELYPIFAGHHTCIEKYRLPRGPIAYEPEQQVNGDTLDMLVHELVREVFAQKKKFSHFTLLQSKNFNYQYPCGLLVLKFNDYPFVLKLFIETPETMANPYCKGIEPIFFFFMAGGANRHFAGLTRIANKNNLEQRIAQHDRWQTMIKFPRKWYWTPHKQRYIHITGHNIGGHKKIHTRIPSVYAIVADEIITTEQEPMPKHAKKRLVMEFCNDMHLLVDPHYTNYIFKRDPVTQKLYIYIIDTEHFPTMVGIKNQKEFFSHTRWYTYLVGKCFHDMYSRTKNRCIAAQYTTMQEPIALPITTVL